MRIRITLLAVIATLAFMPASLRPEVILREDFESRELGDNWEKLTPDSTRANFESRLEYVRSGKTSYRLTSFAHEGPEQRMQGYAYKESDSWIHTWFLPGVEMNRTFLREGG